MSGSGKKRNGIKKNGKVGRHTPSLMLGTRLRFLRDQKGWNQKTLAEKAGVKRTAVAVLENDRVVASEPMLTILGKLATALEVHVGVLTKDLDVKFYRLQPPKVRKAKVVVKTPRQSSLDILAGEYYVLVKRVENLETRLGALVRGLEEYTKPKGLTATHA